jgi:hypothetical protein
VRSIEYLANDLPKCNRPLTKIDYYGEVLVGCIECNRLGRPGDKTFVTWNCWMMIWKRFESQPTMVGKHVQSGVGNSVSLM